MNLFQIGLALTAVNHHMSIEVSLPSTCSLASSQQSSSISGQMMTMWLLSLEFFFVI